MDNEDNWVKSHFKLFIALIAGLVIMIAVVVAVVIVNSNNTNEPTAGSGPLEEPVFEEIPEFNVETSDGYAGYLYATEILQSEEFDIYEGATREDGSLDIQVVVQNIDKAIQKYEITDEKILTIFELRKAEYYAKGHDAENAKRILDNYREDDMLDSQIFAFYNACYSYYNTIGDEVKRDEYHRKMIDYVNDHNY